MLYLGIDPGYANTGVAVLQDNKLVTVMTITNQDGLWTTQFKNLERIMFNLPSIPVVGIEDSMGFGAKRGILGLHKLVGAIWAICWTSSDYVYLIKPKDKIQIPKKYVKRCFTEHEKDAVSLALVAKQLFKMELVKENEC